MFINFIEFMNFYAMVIKMISNFYEMNFKFSLNLDLQYLLRINGSNFGFLISQIQFSLICLADSLYDQLIFLFFINFIIIFILKISLKKIKEIQLYIIFH